MGGITNPASAVEKSTGGAMSEVLKANSDILTSAVSNTISKETNSDAYSSALFTDKEYSSKSVVDSSLLKTLGIGKTGATSELYETKKKARNALLSSDYTGNISVENSSSARRAVLSGKTLGN